MCVCWPIWYYFNVHLGNKYMCCSPSTFPVSNKPLGKNIFHCSLMFKYPGFVVFPVKPLYPYSSTNLVPCSTALNLPTTLFLPLITMDCHPLPPMVLLVGLGSKTDLIPWFHPAAAEYFYHYWLPLTHRSPH